MGKVLIAIDGWFNRFLSLTVTLMKKLSLFAVIFTLFLGLSPTVKGETISLEIGDWSNLTRNTITYLPGGFSFDPVWAGSFKASVPGPDPFETYVFCVELTQNISNSTYTFDIAGLADLDQRYRKIGWLIDHYEPIVGTTNSGALQLAIWEIIYDNTFDLTTGNFRVDSTANFTPNTLLNDIAATFTNEVDFLFDTNRFVVYKNDRVQNLIGLNPDPVPEPATMLLFGGGLAGLAGWRLRRGGRSDG